MATEGATDIQPQKQTGTLIANPAAQGFNLSPGAQVYRESYGYRIVTPGRGDIYLSESRNTIRPPTTLDIPSQRYESGIRPASTYGKESGISTHGYYAPGVVSPSAPTRAPTSPVLESSPVGRTLSPKEAATLGSAPVGSITDVKAAISSGAVGGYVLTTSKGEKEYFLTEQAANLRAMQLSSKPGEPGYHATIENPLGIYQAPPPPKPGEWGYHATPSLPGGIVEANFNEQMQQAIYKVAFAPPSPGLQKAMDMQIAEQWYRGLSPVERAGALIVGGFNKPVEIGGSYFESKFFGGAPTYQSELYKYEIQGAKTVDIPFFGRQYIPKSEVVKETGIGMGALIATGAAFRGVTYVTGLGLKSAVRGAEFTTKELGISAAARTGIFTKTALQTAETFSGLSVKALKYGASHPESVVGMSLTIPFAQDIAASKTKGEALAKIGYLGATIPLMGVGYTGIGEVGAAMPTSKEFFRFVGTKAEPLTPFAEPFTSFVSEKTPGFIRSPAEAFYQKATRQPTAQELMTPALREIYREVSPGRKIKIESAVRLMESLQEAKPEIMKPIDFTSPKYGGRIGENLQAMIKKKPEEYVIGGSTSIGAFVPEFRPGADWDIYARQYLKTAGAVEEMSARAYPGSNVKTARPDMTTIQQETGQSIADIHRLEEIQGKIGKSIATRMEGETVQLTRGKVRKPIKVEGVQYMDVREQMFRKAEGTFKFLKSETMENPPHALVGRKKDIADFTAIVESLARSRAKTTSKAEAERISREIESFKLHSGFAFEEYSTPYYESIKKKPSIPLYGTVTPAVAQPSYYTPADTSTTARYYGLNPADTNLFGFSDVYYSPGTGNLYPGDYINRFFRTPEPGYPPGYTPPYTPPRYTPPYYPTSTGKPPGTPTPTPTPTPEPDIWEGLRYKPEEKKKKKAKPRRKETYFRTPRTTPLREALDPATDIKKTFDTIAKAMTGTKYINSRKGKNNIIFGTRA